MLLGVECKACYKGFTRFVVGFRAFEDVLGCPGSGSKVIWG